MIQGAVKPSRVAAVFLLASLAGAACDDDHRSTPVVDVEAVSSLTIWADLMPTFPEPANRIHAVVAIEFVNLTTAPIVIEVVEVTVTSRRDGRPLHAFDVEPVTEWDGYLPGLGAGTGEWREVGASMLNLAALRCSEPVVGTVSFDAIREDGVRVVVVPSETHTTELTCVY